MTTERRGGKPELPPGFDERELESLTAREQRVLRLRFGLGGEEPRSRRAVGEVIGVSRERARQIEVGALSKLNKKRDPNWAINNRRARLVVLHVGERVEIHGQRYEVVPDEKGGLRIEPESELASAGRCES
jgi:DNA-binding XRE family transcriptional regulator